jgi:hypothetical protein
LDEGMIPWRGHLSFRVYSPDKPVKYGIRAYMLSDSTNGYVSKFKPKEMVGEEEKNLSTMRL